MKNFCVLTLALGLSSFAFGHARWKVGSTVTPPRNTSTGLKSAPCGGVLRTANPLQFKPGTQITVEFEETIQHLGFFEVRFLPANDSADGMANNLLLRVEDNQNNPVAGGVNHQFTGTITLPAAKCDNCTLQLIQVMQDSGPAGPSTNYYSCSDIQLVDNPQPPAATPPPPPPKADNPALLKPTKPEGLKLEAAPQGATP